MALINITLQFIKKIIKGNASILLGEFAIIILAVALSFFESFNNNILVIVSFFIIFNIINNIYSVMNFEKLNGSLEMLQTCITSDKLNFIIPFSLSLIFSITSFFIFLAICVFFNLEFTEIIIFYKNFISTIFSINFLAYLLFKVTNYIKSNINLLNFTLMPFLITPILLLALNFNNPADTSLCLINIGANIFIVICSYLLSILISKN